MESFVFFQAPPLNGPHRHSLSHQKWAAWALDLAEDRPAARVGALVRLGHHQVFSQELASSRSLQTEGRGGGGGGGRQPEKDSQGSLFSLFCSDLLKVARQLFVWVVLVYPAYNPSKPASLACRLRCPKKNPKTLVYAPKYANYGQICQIWDLGRIFARANYGQEGCPWKDLTKCSSDMLTWCQ